MKYIDAVPGTLVSFVVFLILDLCLPLGTPSGDINIILTITTFLFAILIGFFITRLAARYDSVRSSIAQEDAQMLSLYKTVSTFNKRLAAQLATIMDAYYIVAYDFSLSDAQVAYKKTAPIFSRMWNIASKIDQKKFGSAYQMVIQQLTTIEQSRNQSSVVSEENMRLSSWLLIISLAFIILVSVFYIRTNDLYSHIVTIGLSTALTMTLLTLRDLQNMMLGGQALLDESGQEVLESIGKKRYYHESFLASGVSHVPTSVKEYRVGTHTPGAEKHLIKTVRITGVRS